MNNIYLQLLQHLPEDLPLVLATVARSIGSTPQKPGSSALFNHAGLLAGTVGGGILEGEVQKIALKSIQSKESGFYNFKLDGGNGEGLGAICGGQASILVDASPQVHLPVFKQVKQSMIDRVPGVLVAIVQLISGSGVRIERYWLTGMENRILPVDRDRKIETEVRLMLSGRNQIAFREIEIALQKEKDEAMIFLESISPPAHLVIAGAGHIGKALSHIGKLLEFEVTVIDDRAEYANAANLPDADHIIVQDIGEAMNELNITSDTFIVIVTRGHKDDAKALRACIGSDAAYIGMIGSKNKVALMRKDFIQHGWAEPSEWKDIYAPVGLDIQSKSVGEIAISIAAQLIQVKNSKIQVYV
jgi:xanthine dehydrogenase accessory factor